MHVVASTAFSPIASATFRYKYVLTASLAFCTVVLL